MKSIKVNYSVRCAAEPAKGHNRWHCEIPPALEAEPGEAAVFSGRETDRSLIVSPFPSGLTIF